MAAASTATAMPTNTPGGGAANPGNVLASAVDGEMQKLRGLKQELDQLRQDLNIVLSQETENEMVLIELDLLDDNGGSSSSGSILYKLLGPVLVPQPVEEGQGTVRKRLEFIRNEKQRLQEKIASIEQQGEGLSIKIQQMQANLQQQTAQAVRAITTGQHHHHHHQK